MVGETGKGDDEEERQVEIIQKPVGMSKKGEKNCLFSSILDDANRNLFDSVNNDAFVDNPKVQEVSPDMKGEGTITINENEKEIEKIETKDEDAVTGRMTVAISCGVEEDTLKINEDTVIQMVENRKRLSYSMYRYMNQTYREESRKFENGITCFRFYDDLKETRERKCEERNYRKKVRKDRRDCFSNRM